MLGLNLNWTEWGVHKSVGRCWWVAYVLFTFITLLLRNLRFAIRGLFFLCFFLFFFFPSNQSVWSEWTLFGFGFCGVHKPLRWERSVTDGRMISSSRTGLELTYEESTYLINNLGRQWRDGRRGWIITNVVLWRPWQDKMGISKLRWFFFFSRNGGCLLSVLCGGEGYIWMGTSIHSVS